jgi:hypothetical protein
MRKHLLLFCLLFIAFPAIAQQTLVHQNSLHLSLGRSFHGSGDLSGIWFSAEYGHYFNNRFEVSGNVSSTIHYGAYHLFVSGPTGNFDGSFRYVTAGLQTGSKLGFALLRLKQHEIKIQAGAFFRYQSSSLPDVYGVTFPPAINYPEPVYTFRQYEKQNTFSVGYSADISYIFSTTKNLRLGIKAGFQNDSNSDAITQIALVIGKHFKGKKQR